MLNSDSEIEILVELLILGVRSGEYLEIKLQIWI